MESNHSIFELLKLIFFSGNSSTPREFPTGIGANGKPVDSCEICSKTWQIFAAFTVEGKFTMEKKEKSI